MTRTPLQENLRSSADLFFEEQTDNLELFTNGEYETEQKINIHTTKAPSIPSPITEPTIIDNSGAVTLLSALNDALTKNGRFKVVTAFLSPEGVLSLINTALNDQTEIKIIYGYPGTMLRPGTAAVAYYKEKEHTLCEDANAPEDMPKAMLDQQLSYNYAARRFKAWLSNNKNVEIRRAVTDRLIHGKLYLVDCEKNNPVLTVVGSSNFTLQGLGAGRGTQGQTNIELNHVVGSHQEATAWRDHYDLLWKDHTVDCKQDVIQELGRTSKRRSGRDIYLKILFHHFAEELEYRDRVDKDIKLVNEKYGTNLWERLMPHQRSGTQAVLSKLDRRGVCMLCDEVGLGKTWTALAVIKYYQLKKRGKCVVIVPPNLKDQWHQEINVHYTEEKRPGLLTYSSFNAKPVGGSTGKDLYDALFGGADLVVIDESHILRNGVKNEEVNKYSRLRDAIREKASHGVHVLMLTATPVSTGSTDLVNQIMIAKQQNINLPPREAHFISLLRKKNPDGIAVALQWAVDNYVVMRTRKTIKQIERRRRALLRCVGRVVVKEDT